MPRCGRLPNAEELQANAALAYQIVGIVIHRHDIQVETAPILDTDQLKVSELLAGRLDGFSLERLIRFLNAPDRDVQIIVSPKPRNRARATLKMTAKSHPLRIGSPEPTQALGPTGTHSLKV